MESRELTLGYCENQSPSYLATYITTDSLFSELVASDRPSPDNGVEVVDKMLSKLYSKLESRVSRVVSQASVQVQY